LLKHCLDTFIANIIDGTFARFVGDRRVGASGEQGLDNLSRGALFSSGTVHPSTLRRGAMAWIQICDKPDLGLRHAPEASSQPLGF